MELWPHLPHELPACVFELRRRVERVEAFINLARRFIEDQRVKGCCNSPVQAPRRVAREPHSTAADSTESQDLEDWKDIPAWPYQASNLGRIRRTKPAPATRPGRVLRPRLMSNGYLYVELQEAPRSRYVAVHILVAEAYLGSRPTGMFVNHKDGVKTNNRPGNLEYVTLQENMDHASRNGLIRQGDRAPQAKLTWNDVLVIRALKGTVSQRELARRFGVSKAAIGQAQRGTKSWLHPPE